MQKSVEYYNKVFSSSTTYNLPYLLSPYLPLWVSVLRHIPRDVSILELGCGTGQFAEMLHDFGYLSYTGVDFSIVAVEKAKERNNSFKFMCRDFFSQDIIRLLSDVDRFCVCLETLEHIDNDLGLLDIIKKGTFLIASVPTFKSESHIRYFQNETDITKRYGGVLSIDTMFRVDRFFVFKGILQ